MDPHHFEPSLKEIKALMQAKVLVLAPKGINPWAQKLVSKRLEKTYTLTIPTKFFDRYKTKNDEALAHFWMYPDILCHFKNDLKKTGKTLKELDCSAEALKTRNQKLTKLIGNKKIVITHDALSPLFTFHGAKVLALVESDHGHRPNVSTYKKLADWQKKDEQIIWLLEKDVKTNNKILQKIKSSDIKLNLDITGNINQDPFFIWDALIKELESKLYAKPNS
jgi:ABC-type Zn uptake system ZnuABC Zn-binding protein ZnuA